MFRIATWNVNSLRVRLPHVLQWLDKEKPDVLALQETKTIDENFPAEEIQNAGYEARYAGQKTYNGVATLSKTEISESITGLPGFDDPQKRILCNTINNVSVLNIYVPNGSEVGSEKYLYKLDWLKHLHAFIESLLLKNKHIIVLGDFNIAPEDRDVHDPIEWEGKVLVSQAERDNFNHLIELGLVDSFRLFEQEEDSFSWWDYRAASFRRNRGLRIDHILVSQALADKCGKCYIDKTPRQLDRPSDHTPVIAEFDI